MADINEIDELMEILDSARVDYYKTYTKDVKAASIRLRRKLEDVARRCREIKADVLEYRKDIIDKKNKEKYVKDDSIHLDQDE